MIYIESASAHSVNFNAYFYWQGTIQKHFPSMTAVIFGFQVYIFLKASAAHIISYPLWTSATCLNTASTKIMPYQQAFIYNVHKVIYIIDDSYH